MAEFCVEQAARDGYALALQPDTPVIPHEHFRDLIESTTWAGLEAPVRRLVEGGCA